MFRELLDWYEEPFLTLRPYLTQPIRVEDYFEDSRYVIRADLAGIDPEKDLELTTSAGYVTIHAQRSTAMEVKLRSEFRYGAFSRTLQLPAGVDEGDVRADYRDGMRSEASPMAVPAPQQRVRDHGRLVSAQGA